MLLLSTLVSPFVDSWLIWKPSCVPKWFQLGQQLFSKGVAQLAAFVRGASSSLSPFSVAQTNTKSIWREHGRLSDISHASSPSCCPPAIITQYGGGATRNLWLLGFSTARIPEPPATKCPWLTALFRLVMAWTLSLFCYVLVATRFCVNQTSSRKSVSSS